MVKLRFETVPDFLHSKALGLQYSTGISGTLVVFETLLKEINSARLLYSDFYYFCHTII